MPSDRILHLPIVYEVMPFRRVWIVRRRGSRQERLYPTRDEALERAEMLCRMESRAELVVFEPEPRSRSA